MNKLCCKFLSKYCTSKKANLDGYLDSTRALSCSVRFLGLYMDKCLTRNNHAKLLLNKLKKLFTYFISIILFVVTLKIIYYTYIYSHMTYGIVFWSCSAASRRICTLQKRILRAMAGALMRISFLTIFKDNQVLPFPSVYIFILYHSHFFL